jgi:hypothetical protein
MIMDRFVIYKEANYQALENFCFVDYALNAKKYHWLESIMAVMEEKTVVVDYEYKAR